jgi:hypothetical protein
VAGLIGAPGGGSAPSSFTGGPSNFSPVAGLIGALGGGSAPSSFTGNHSQSTPSSFTALGGLPPNYNNNPLGMNFSTSCGANANLGQNTTSSFTALGGLPPNYNNMALWQRYHQLSVAPCILHLLRVFHLLVMVQLFLQTLMHERKGD